MTSLFPWHIVRLMTGKLHNLICCGLVVGLTIGCARTETPRSTPGSEPATSSNTTDGGLAAPAPARTIPASESAKVPEVSQNQPEKTPTFEPAPAGKVLRHAVFFSFKESSTKEDIQRIVAAFRDLPSKIPEIIDFQWGVNNSPEGRNDGFTHCFLLTFKDEAGRAAYLPHDAHKAFGDVLRGHNDKVFVIDYWGDANQEPLEKELKHAVFFRFKKDAAAEQIQKVEAAFAELPSKIDAIKRFEWGINNSPERHAAGFTHCFMVSFDSEEGRAAYLPHPDHLAFVEILQPVLDAPRVLDFWAEK